MKWIGQHIYNYISRFRDDVYLENISSGTIASGGNLGLDSDNKIVKQSDTGITDLHGAGVDGSADQLLTDDGDGTVTSEQYLTFANADNTSTLNLLSNQDTGDYFKIGVTTHGATNLRTVDDDAQAAHLTFYPDGDLINQAKTGLNYWYRAVNTDDYLKLEIGTNGEATFTTVDAAAAAADMTFTPDGMFLVNSDDVRFISDQANDPLVQIRCDEAGATGGRLRFLKRRGGVEDGQANDVCGTIEFYSNDDGTPSTHNYAQIQGTILSPVAGEEGGKLTIGVSCIYDAAMENGLVLSSGDADGEVDATIGSGAASVTTVAGTLTMGSTAAMTNAGLLVVGNQTGITGVGTISSGVWQGTAIAEAYTKHIIFHDFKGYAIGDGSNFERPPSMTDAQNPFEHNNTAVGSDGLTAHDVSDLFRTGGKVMSRDGTIKRITGWATGSGTTATCEINFVKWTPVRNNTGNVTPVLLENWSFTALGNDAMEDFDETSFSQASVTKGDIIYTQVKTSASGVTVYFNATMEIEV